MNNNKKMSKIDILKLVSYFLSFSGIILACLYTKVTLTIACVVFATSCGMNMIIEILPFCSNTKNDHLS